VDVADCALPLPRPLRRSERLDQPPVVPVGVMASPQQQRRVTTARAAGITSPNATGRNRQARVVAAVSPLVSRPRRNDGDVTAAAGASEEAQAQQQEDDAAEQLLTRTGGASPLEASSDTNGSAIAVSDGSSGSVLAAPYSSRHGRYSSVEVGEDEALAQEIDYSASPMQRPLPSPISPLTSTRLDDSADERSNLSPPGEGEQSARSLKGAMGATPRGVSVQSRQVAPVAENDNSSATTDPAAAASVPRSITLPTFLGGNPAPNEPRFGATGVYACLISAQLCWSGFHVLAKTAFNYMHPMALPMIRALLTTPILFAICYAQDKDFWRKVSRADLKLLALLGTIVCAMQQTLFNLGLMLTTAADGGIMQPAVPVFAAVMAIALGREKGGWLKISGICCAVLGTLCIVIGETYLVPTKQAEDDTSPLTSGGGSESTNNDASSDEITPTRRLAGLSCFLMQCFLFSIYLLLQKPLLARLPTLTITFYTFLFGTVGATAVGGYFVAQIDWPHLPAMWFVAIAYTVLFASIAGFLLFSYATKHLPATASSMGVTLQPFFSSMLGATILGELLTYMHVVGGIFLIAGLVIVLWSRQKEAKVIAAGALLPAAAGSSDVEQGATSSARSSRAGSRVTSPRFSAHQVSIELTGGAGVSSAPSPALTPVSPLNTPGGGGEWMVPRAHRGSIDGFDVDVLGPSAALDDQEQGLATTGGGYSGLQSPNAAAASGPPSSKFAQRQPATSQQSPARQGARRAVAAEEENPFDF